jgi:signal transduction histidine kinase
MAHSTTLNPPGQPSASRQTLRDPAQFSTLLDVLLREPTIARVQRLHLWYHAAHLLAAQTDLDALLDPGFGALLDILGVPQSLLYAHHEGDHALYLLAERGVAPELRAALQRLPVDATDPRIGARAAATRCVQITPGFWAAPATTATTHTLVTLPLIAGGSLLGVWQLLPSWRHAPDGEDLMIFEAIGDELTTALRRARLIAALAAQDNPTARHAPHHHTEHIETGFISTVSHELRTPLTSIAGYTELLLDGTVGTLNEEQQSSLSIVKNNVDRLTSMIEDLLDISRIASGRVPIKREPVDMNHILAQAVELLRPQILRKAQEVSLELEAHLPPVWGDTDRLVRAVINLVMNAHKYTPEYGQLRITSGMAGEMVTVAVTDTGIGLTPEQQEHLFEQFYRAGESTDSIRRGVGLGLMITRSIAQIHGGDILVASQAGQGSTFTLRLPQRNPGAIAEDRRPLLE